MCSPTYLDHKDLTSAPLPPSTLKDCSTHVFTLT